MRLFAGGALVAGLFLTGCGGAAFEESAASRPSTSAAEMPVCPEGTTFLASHRLCVTEKDAIGPFTQSMIDKCIAYGGGDAACKGERWSRAFALKLRGTGRCMSGSVLDGKSGLCVSGDLAYGPFTREQVDKCISKEGGERCSSMRIHRFYLSDTPDPYKGERNYIRITKQNWYFYGGLYALKMELLSKDGAPVDALFTVSGQDYAQKFRKAEVSKRGSYEPLPEGLWRVRYPNAGTGGNEWAGAIGDYGGSLGEGLGPTFQEIVLHEGFETDRTAIGIHLDSNRSSAPGTAGCVGLASMADLKRYIGWFSDSAVAPRTFVVDWGLGTIPGTYDISEELRSLTNFGLQDAYLPLMERLNLIEGPN